jgi:hypothetical protein
MLCDLVRLDDNLLSDKMFALLLLHLIHKHESENCLLFCNCITFTKFVLHRTFFFFFCHLCCTLHCTKEHTYECLFQYALFYVYNIWIRFRHLVTVTSELDTFFITIPGNNFHYDSIMRLPQPGSWALTMLWRNCIVSVILEFLYLFPKEDLLFLYLVSAWLYACWLQQPTHQVPENHPRRILMQDVWLSSKSWLCWTVCMVLQCL